MYIVKVLVEHSVHSLDQTYDYLSDQVIELYTRVKIHFGHQNLVGFVVKVDIYDGTIEELTKEKGFKLKRISAVLDQESLLNDELRDLALYLSKQSLASLISCFKVMLPNALKPSSQKQVQIKYMNQYQAIDHQSKLTPKQQACYDFISDHPLCSKDMIPFSKGIIDQLVKKGCVAIQIVESYRQVSKDYENKKQHQLNPLQQKAYDDIFNTFNQSQTHLLFGVTGSGKTEIYMQLTKEVLTRNKTVLMLVPEIALTPMMIQHFKSRFHNAVAILHSKLSNGERYDEYRRIKKGEAKIVVGARSAIFAPLDHIGLIIMDEEHDASYRQETNPRYHTRDLAIFRSQYHECPLILGSATPSLESFARANKGVYQLHELKERISKHGMPSIEVVDMKACFNNHRMSIFSPQLETAIQSRIDLNQQVILLLNRRGYASFVSCRSCGHVIKCPHCDVSLTYHYYESQLHCHYCDYKVEAPKVCPQCQSNSIKHVGIGTQQVEQQILKTFNNAKVIRMDADTTKQKDGHEVLLDQFRNHEGNILLGTQMIAKGIDFEDVTLVGVLNADMSLYYPDFRSSERTFQLLTQVAGRSGRHDKKGEVIIQTYNLDHPSIQYALNHDYVGFYHHEMMYRKISHYPPYFYMVTLLFTCVDLEILEKEMIEVYKYLKQHHGFEMLGPTTPSIAKIQDLYRREFMIKYKNREHIQPLLEVLHSKYNKQVNKVRLIIQFD